MKQLKERRTLARFLSASGGYGLRPGLLMMMMLLATLFACKSEWIVHKPPPPATETPSQDTTTHPGDTENPGTPPGDPSTTPPKDTATPPASSVLARECSTPKPGWLFCDDFETDRLGQYFEYDRAGGNFVRHAGSGVSGSWSMRAHFGAGQVSVGSLKLAFGKTPSTYFRAVDQGKAVYRELYWRMYLRNDAGWTGGGGDKLSRAQVIASSSWAQAMVAPVWSGASASNRNYLVIDPVRGTDDSGRLLTTKYNDFDHHTFLGATRGAFPLFDAANVGKWHCIEARVRLNDAGKSNGVFELWINGQLQASRTNLNWLGSYSTYGLNALFFENFWNAGSPKQQDRYMDNIVVSTSRIGC